MNLNLRTHPKSIKQQISELPRGEMYWIGLEKIQKKCNHNYVRSGHDANGEYKRCEHCGLLETI